MIGPKLMISVACLGEATRELLLPDCSVCLIGSIFQEWDTTPKHRQRSSFKGKGSPVQDLPV